MNIKTLRKTYETLTTYQRLALLDNAISRGDESEAEAICAASPRKTISQPDYLDLFEEITKIRLCNLIVRLGYIMNFDVLNQAYPDDLNRTTNSKLHERTLNSLRLVAFLYVRATDSWNALSDELGLRSNFDEEIGSFLFQSDLLRLKDKVMREFAFSEDQAKEYILKHTGSSEFKTIDQEIQGYREYLKLE